MDHSLPPAAVEDHLFDGLINFSPSPVKRKAGEPAPFERVLTPTKTTPKKAKSAKQRTTTLSKKATQPQKATPPKKAKRDSDLSSPGASIPKHVESCSVSITEPAALNHKNDPNPTAVLDLTAHLNLLPLITSFADHDTLLTLRLVSRSAYLVSTSQLYDHVAVLARGDAALLVTPTAPFRRLPLDPTSPNLPCISVLDALSTYPSYDLGRTLPLPLLSSAFDKLTAAHPLTLLRVVWYPHTYCLQVALNALQAGVGYDDLTIILDAPLAYYQEGYDESYATGLALMDAMGEYLLEHGSLTIVGAKRYFRAWGVPPAYTGLQATEWVRRTLQIEGFVGDEGGGKDGEEVAGRLRLVTTREWEREGESGEGRLERVKRLERVGVRPFPTW